MGGDLIPNEAGLAKGNGVESVSRICANGLSFWAEPARWNPRQNKAQPSLCVCRVGRPNDVDSQRSLRRERKVPAYEEPVSAQQTA